MHDGIKCIACVERALRDKLVNTAKPVQDAVDGAKAAVITRNGDSLCAEHLHERLVARAAARAAGDLEFKQQQKYLSEIIQDMSDIKDTLR
jgi:hypothetical protein